MFSGSYVPWRPYDCASVVTEVRCVCTGIVNLPTATCSPVLHLCPVLYLGGGGNTGTSGAGGKGDGVGDIMPPMNLSRRCSGVD